jgi:hypothetical protein
MKSLKNEVLSKFIPRHLTSARDHERGYGVGGKRRVRGMSDTSGGTG